MPAGHAVTVRAAGLWWRPAYRSSLAKMTTRALGLDLGSSSVRAIVFETSHPGQLSSVPGALARRPRQLVLEEPGQATFDPAGYFADLVACVDELHGAGVLEGVTDVALGSQWHSVLVVDTAGQPVTDVISWADTRPRRPRPACTPEALEALRQRTGCAFAPMYWTWRVPWLRAGLRGAGGRASAVRFVGLPEYVGLELLADPSMSVSMASGTGLLSTFERRWDEEALDLAGVGPSELPLLAPADWEGHLAGAWRRRWPDIAEASWHPAMGDGAAANLGVGCDRPSRAAMTIGTSAAVRVVRPDRRSSHPGLPAGLWRYCVDHERTVTGAAYSSGGQLYAWALALWEGPGVGGTGSREAAGPAESGRQAADKAQTAPAGARATGTVRFDVSVPVAAGSDGVLVLPWHAGTRPPAPLVPAGRGVVVGLGLRHNGAHIVSAAVEAVCFQLAGGLADLEAGLDQWREAPLEVVANGGAIEGSPWWKGRLAATLGRPVLCPNVPETTAMGAVAAALGLDLGAGAIEGEVVEPAADDVAALAQARRRWAECYEKLLPIATIQPD
jgi:gluconokinase